MKYRARLGSGFFDFPKSDEFEDYSSKRIRVDHKIVGSETRITDEIGLELMGKSRGYVLKQLAEG